MKIKKRVFIDYSLLLLTIAVSGIPYFTTSILYVPLFVILFIVFLLRNKKFNPRFLIFLLLLLFLTFLQSYVFDFYSFNTTIGVLLRVLNGYLIMQILDKKFLSYFINVIYYIAISSLFIYFSILVVPSVENILFKLSAILDVLNISGSTHKTIIIYNLSKYDQLRNSGPFWEPGAFAGYLMLAYIFNAFIMYKKQKKIAILLIVSIATTLSTTAYIAMFLFSFFFFYKQIKNIFVKIIVFTMILISAYYAFFNFEFLGNKISHQLELAINVDPYTENTNTQRFLNIMRDMEDLKDHEILGRGSNPYTRYSYDPENQIRTVGLTDILVRMGIPMFLLILLMMFYSLCAVIHYYGYKSILYCIGTFVTILIMLMSEVYFNFPLYWSLLFLSLVYKKPKKERLR